MSEERKRNLTWIPWTIAAIALGTTLFSNAVSYGGDKKTIADTAIFVKTHCEKQEAKEKEVDTVLGGLKIQLAVSQSQNAMILESLTALRKEIKELEK